MAPPKVLSNVEVIRQVGPLMGLFTLEAFAFGIIVPLMPIATTEYFARQYTQGIPIDCGRTSHDPACIQGSKDADWWLSVIGAIGSFGFFLLSPTLGQASDSYGRKPFIVISQFTRLGLPFTIMYFVERGGSIWPYFGLRFICSVFETMGIGSAAVADVVSPENRAAAFGLLYAVSSIGFCVSAGMAGLFSRHHVLLIAGALFVMRVLWAIFLVSETLPLAKRTRKTRRPLRNPIRGLAILGRSQLFIRLTAMIALTSFVSAGISQIRMFYLNTTVGFDEKDTSKLFLAFGVGSILAQVLLLKPLMQCGKERGVIIVALLGRIIELGGYVVSTFIPEKWVIYATVAPSSVGDLSFAAISSLKSVNVSESEQGRLQGAVYAARAVFEAVGPIVYAYIYNDMKDEDKRSQILPFALSIVLYVCGIGVATLLPSSSGPFMVASVPFSPATSTPPSPSVTTSVATMDFDEDDDALLEEERDDEDLDATETAKALAEPLLGDDPRTPSMPPSVQSLRVSSPPSYVRADSALRFGIRRVRALLVAPTKLQLLLNVWTLCMALGGLALAVVVIIEIGTIVAQIIMSALNAKQDVAVQVLRDTLAVMDQLGAAGLGDGKVSTPSGLVYTYETTLGQRYNDERVAFRRYVDAIDARRYASLKGMTRSLFPNVSAVRSAMGGIDFGPDWWEMARSYVDIEGGVMFSGNSVDKTLMARNYSDLVTFLGVDPANPVLSDAMVSKLLPRSAIPKVTQVGEFKYKLYSTDPEKLDSFNIHLATDAWLANLGAIDAVTHATCRLLPKPTLPKFYHVFGAFWCPRSFPPSAAYASRFKEAPASDVGLWVVECDSKHDYEAKLQIIRWHGQMPERYSTAFYLNAVKLTSPRKAVYTQAMLFNLTAYGSGNAYPIRDIVALASTGKLEALPAKVYVVQTEPIPERIRTAILGITFVCVLFTRCTFTGVRTLCHFMLESSVSIALDIVYAVFTYPSGTELAVIVATVRHGHWPSAVVHLAMTVRRFSTLALIIAKTALSLFYGFQEITPCITIRESIVLVMLQVLVLFLMAPALVGTGMKKNLKTGHITSSDDMTTFVWTFNGLIWLVALVFIFLRYKIGKLVSRWSARQLSRRRVVSSIKTATTAARTLPSEPTGESTAKSKSSPTASSSAYDDYLSGKLLSFGVWFLERRRVKGRECRVIDGNPLVLDALFNFNLNGFGHYTQLQNQTTIIHVTATGRFDLTDVPLAPDYPLRTGNVVLG
ncbi:hypothetical protein PINS_up001384 [Pythium insidiosum]|nr:hypothetical protein PINS_up001384 [Pythium insidiosum]